MAMKQGDLALLEHPVAKELLVSNIPARVAYVWTDGTPRVTPIWFHWDGRELVLGTAPNAAKLKALAQNPRVAVTIDDNHFPHKVLLIRGTARLETVDGVVPEYAQAAERYLGHEQGRAWIEQMHEKRSGMVRIAITPESTVPSLAYTPWRAPCVRQPNPRKLRLHFPQQRRIWKTLHTETHGIRQMVRSGTQPR